MKDKEIIEEIAQIIHNSLPDIYTTKLCEKGDCIADKVFDKPCWCIYKEIAEKIYYKIFSEDIVVLSGLELADYKHYKEYTKSLAQASKETAERDFNKIIKELEERKDRVKIIYGIAERRGIDMAISVVERIAKQLGVEIEG